MLGEPERRESNQDHMARGWSRGGREAEEGKSTCSFTCLVHERSELALPLKTEALHLFPLLLPRNR